MARRKQVVPKRRADAAEWGKDAIKDNLEVLTDGSPVQAAQHVLQAGTAKKQRTSHHLQHEDITIQPAAASSISGFADFIVATRRQGESGSETSAVADSTVQQLTIKVQQFDLQREELAVDSWMLPKEAFLLTWGGDDEPDMQHKVRVADTHSKACG